jgi:hypothetical protein
MTELSKRAQSLIDAARSADDATPEARTRGDAAVRVALAMHGLTDLPPLEPPRLSAPAPEATISAKVAHTGVGLKIGLGAALLSATLVAVFARPGTTAPKRAASTPAPQAAARVPAEPVAALPAVVLPGPRSTAELEHDETPVRLHRHAGRKPATSSDALEAEVRLLSAANGLVRTQRFAAALRVLDEHARRFPRGALREERKALRVLSLCGADAYDVRARRERERFLRRAPSSVLIERVRAVCAAGSAT